MVRSDTLPIISGMHASLLLAASQRLVQVAHTGDPPPTDRGDGEDGGTSGERERETASRVSSSVA